MAAKTRTPEQIFDHHGEALGSENLEQIVADYSDDAILIVQKEVYSGKDGARRVFSQLLKDIPHAKWELPATVFAGDILYLEWRAVGGGRKIDDGTDTFVFRDGLIRAQTVVYTLRLA